MPNRSNTRKNNSFRWKIKAVQMGSLFRFNPFIMSFPYTLSGKIRFGEQDYKTTDEELLNDFESYLSTRQGVKSVERIDKTVVYKSNDALLKFLYEVEININIGVELELFYRIQISELLKIILLLVVFTAFFSEFSFDAFLLFSGIIAAITYFINAAYVSSIVRRTILNFPSFENFEQIETKSELAENEKLCSACGKSISIYEITCPYCNQKIKNYTPVIPGNITKYSNKTVSYHVRKNKN